MCRVSIGKLSKPFTVDGEKAFSFGVPQHESKFAIEMLEHIEAVLFIEMKNDLNITLGPKDMTGLRQFFTQFSVVIDFAIADQR